MGGYERGFYGNTTEPPLYPTLSLSPPPSTHSTGGFSSPVPGDAFDEAAEQRAVTEAGLEGVQVLPGPPQWGRGTRKCVGWWGQHAFTGQERALFGGGEVTGVVSWG